MFKLVQLLGALVGKMYVRQAKVLNRQAKAADALSGIYTTKAAELVSKSKKWDEAKELKLQESARIAMQAQVITKFFK